MNDNMNKSLAQDKVLILYVLSNVKTDVTESDIFKIISPVNNINYFYGFRKIDIFKFSVCIYFNSMDRFSSNSNKKYNENIKR